MKQFKNMMTNEDGQGMVEYGLLIGLIAIVVIAALVILGPKIANLFKNVSNTLPAGTTAAA